MSLLHSPATCPVSVYLTRFCPRYILQQHIPATCPSCEATCKRGVLRKPKRNKAPKTARHSANWIKLWLPLQQCIAEHQEPITRRLHLPYIVESTFARPHPRRAQISRESMSFSPTFAYNFEKKNGGRGDKSPLGSYSHIPVSFGPEACLYSRETLVLDLLFVNKELDWPRAVESRIISCGESL